MKSNFESLKRILYQLNYILTQKQKRDSVLVFFSMIIGTALELLGVSAIYPFLQMMLTPQELKEKWYISWIYHLWPDIQDTTIMLFIGILLITIYVFKNFFMILSAYIQNLYAAKFQRETSVNMLHAFLCRPYQFFLNTNSSIILRGIENNVEGTYQIQLNIFTLLAESLTIFILGVFLFAMDWKMALSAMSLALICLLVVVLGFKGKMKEAGTRMLEAQALRYQYAYQAVNGIKEIIVLDRKRNFEEQYEKAAMVTQKSKIINGFLSACPDRILEGVCVSGFIGIVCIKILSGAKLDTFVPVLGTFAMAAFKILPSVSKVSSRINSIIFYQVHLGEVYDNFKIAYGYEKEDSNNYFVKDITDGVKKYKFDKEVTIENIDWKYLNAKEKVLNKVSLTIKKGEAIAFIGSSGAGKTTLADIIMGLLKPQTGTVRVDGADIFSIPHQWAKIIGYVPQSVFLIDDTVKRNVAFGLTKEMIDDDKVWAVLEQAQLKKFVEGLPDGLETIVGERGIKFSGGQKQRIAIARALYEDPDIIVLDEATSSLDSETEAAVMESIETLQGVKTLIIVAHRLTTIKNCDKIYEIVDGIAVLKDKESIIK